jgi:hypothetical protein
VQCGQVFKLSSLCRRRQNTSRNKIPLWQLVPPIRYPKCLSVVYCKLQEIKVSKARVISCCRKTNWHVFDSKLCASSITHTNCVGDLGVLISSKLHFQQQVYNTFCQAISLLSLIRMVTVSFSSLHGLLKLFCASIRPKLESVLCC